MNNRLIKLIVPIVILIAIVYLHPGIQFTEHVPPVFDQSQFQTEFKHGGTWIHGKSGDAIIFPITHDEKGTIYILNGSGEDLIRYSFLRSMKLTRPTKK